ncbi:hypothetical protein [Nocardioides convexus]|nr:hypothetical protein [Nocardioides convexus]
MMLRSGSPLGDPAIPWSSLHGVQKWYGDLHVLQDIEFHRRAG